MKQRRFMQHNVKKIFIIALVAAISVLVARKTYRYLFMSQQSIVVAGEIDKCYQDGKPLAYDYARLISVIERTIELKKTFYQQFFSESSQSRPVGRKEAKELLADLYREKVRLIKFDRQMRVRFKGDVPPKKKRTVTHYQRIIDKCIYDTELIVRQL